MSGIEAALASGVLKVAGGKLVSLIASEFASITGVKKDLSDLQDIHGEITSWLAAVRERSIESDPQFRWVMKLKDVAYDIDDLLHEVELEAEKHKIHRSNDTRRAIFDSIYAKPKFRRKVAHKIKDIKVGYDAIVAQRRDANTVLDHLHFDQPVQSRIKATIEQTLLIDAGESKIPVRDQLKTKIVSKIVESNKGEDSHILSIVGLGGSGKTTLAQHICHNDRIKDIFKSTIYWVHVSSEEFSKEKLIAKLFEAITKEKSDARTPQYVVDKISSKLQGKKFLLVLDDAWHDKRQDWEQFMKLLNSGASGSTILLTTRDQNVAKAVESKIIFNLECLTQAESWSFFLKSSGWMEEDLNNDFIQVGKDIVKKCGGVPLPIKTLGGVLRDKTGINTWRAISESNLWDEKDIEGQVFASLKMSYIHLEDHLKQCFAFCSIFPKGYGIKKDYLIEQWMGHGFIKLMGEEQPDDIGSEYFDSLVKAGFFLIVDAPFWSRRKESICTMHDLIHELARYCLQNEVVTLSLRKNVATGYSPKCRYLSLTSGTKRVNRDQFDKVRALYMTDGNLSFDKQIKKSYHIRSIVVENEKFTKFPSFILKFEYLRYLEIHFVECKIIPEAISGFWNLQALHFIDCNGFVTLPESVGRLQKLRTLELNKIRDLESLPQSISDCRVLQSLQLYSCQKIRNIPASLGKNGSLRVLRIVYCKELKQLPSEIIGEFGNLQEINISECRDLQDLPTTLSCPTLCTLDLSGTKVTMLPQWVTTIGTLKCINLRCCRELVELPEGMGNLKSLAVLDTEGCSRLSCMPSGIGQLTLLEKLGLFVVGCREGDARISELGNLGKLRGGMQIGNLKHLKDSCDAEKACLKRKNKIQYLKLDWSLSQAEVEVASDVEQQQAVMSALEPPSQIESLEINGYRGPCLPYWMMERNDSSFCEGMTLKQTVPCQFLSLTKLTLQQFLNLKHMRGLLKFPSLKFLELKEMAILEELWTTASSFEIPEEDVRAQEDCFPVLSKLSIQNCMKLIAVKPCFPPSLEELYLDKCNLQLLSPGNLSHQLPPSAHESSSSCSQHFEVPCLRVLRLEGTTGPSSGWEFLQHCNELETLSIDGCDDLTQLTDSIRNLTSLVHLYIYNCSTLCALPEWLGELKSLRKLDVSLTPMIASLPRSIGHLTSLTSLRIFGLTNLKLLPDAIQHLASLEYLELMFCGALAVLPDCIGQLSTLRGLRIQGCSTLECLPQSIQQLTALQSLVISGCPALARRYKQGVGPDWHLVSHIPRVTIDLEH